MSQQNFHSDEFRRARKIRVGQASSKRTSRLAVAALAGNALCVVPGIPALMAVLGFKARGNIRRSPLILRGTPLAWSAVALGVVLTAGQGLVGWMGFQELQATRGGAALALDRGLSGDVDGFVDAFVDEGERIEREIAAEVFLGEAALRFGELVSVEPVSGGVWSPDNLKQLVLDGEQQFALNFKEGRVRMHAVLGQRGLKPRLSEVQLIDPVRGTMTFPGLSTVADHPGFSEVGR